jgi:hypothetical protein
VSFGIFEAAVSSEQEAGIAKQAAKDQFDAAVYDVRERLGPALFQASSIEEFRDRVACMKNDQSIYRIISPHLMPITGVVRRIVGKNGILENEFRTRIACGGTCTGPQKCEACKAKEARRRYADGGDLNPFGGEHSLKNMERNLGGPGPFMGTGGPPSPGQSGANIPAPGYDGSTQGTTTGAPTPTPGGKAPAPTGPLINLNPPPVPGPAVTNPGPPPSWPPPGTPGAEPIGPDIDPTTGKPKGTPPPATSPHLSRRYADFADGVVDTDATFKPSEGKLIPKDNWEGYKSKVDQGAAEKVDRNFQSRLRRADAGGTYDPTAPSSTGGGTTPGGGLGGMSGPEGVGQWEGEGGGQRKTPPLNPTPAQGGQFRPASYRRAYAAYARWCAANGRSPARLSSLDAYAARLSDADYLRLAAIITGCDYESDHHPKVPGTKLKNKDKVSRRRSAGEHGLHGYYDQYGTWGGSDPATNPYTGERDTAEDVPGQHEWEWKQPKSRWHNQPGKHRAARDPMRVYVAWCRRNGLAKLSARNINYFAQGDPQVAYYLAMRAKRAIRMAYRRYAEEYSGSGDVEKKSGPFAGGGGKFPVGTPKDKKDAKSVCNFPSVKAKNPSACGKVEKMKVSGFGRQYGEPEYESYEEGPSYGPGATGRTFQRPVRRPKVKPPQNPPKTKGASRRYAAPDYLQKADDALTQLLNQKAEEFQQTIAPLQQALVTVQQAEQIAQQQNPMNVLPPPGTVNVLPNGGPGGGAGAEGGAPGGGGAAGGAPGGGPGIADQLGMPAPGEEDLSGAANALANPIGGGPPGGEAGGPPPPEMQMAARRGGQGKGRGVARPLYGEAVSDLWRGWLKRQPGGLGRGGETDYQQFQSESGVGERAMNKLRKQIMTKPDWDVINDPRAVRTQGGTSGYGGVTVGRRRQAAGGQQPQPPPPPQPGQPRTLPPFGSDFWNRTNQVPPSSPGIPSGGWQENSPGGGLQKQMSRRSGGAHDYDPDNPHQIFAPARGHGWEHASGPSGRPYERPQLTEKGDSGKTPRGRHEGRRKVAWSGWGPAQFPKVREVPGWTWDTHLNGYLANRNHHFACDCGQSFPTPTGFRVCGGCGKQWNSYVIGTGGNVRSAAAEKFLVREIPVRKEGDMIVASRRRAGDVPGYNSPSARLLRETLDKHRGNRPVEAIEAWEDPDVHPDPFDPRHMARRRRAAEYRYPPRNLGTGTEKSEFGTFWTPEQEQAVIDRNVEKRKQELFERSQKRRQPRKKEPPQPELSPVLQKPPSSGEQQPWGNYLGSRRQAVTPWKYHPDENKGSKYYGLGDQPLNYRPYSPNDQRVPEDYVHPLKASWMDKYRQINPEHSAYEAEQAFFDRPTNSTKWVGTQKVKPPTRAEVQEAWAPMRWPGGRSPRFGSDVQLIDPRTGKIHHLIEAQGFTHDWDEERKRHIRRDTGESPKGRSPMQQDTFQDQIYAPSFWELQGLIDEDTHLDPAGRPGQPQEYAQRGMRNWQQDRALRMDDLMGYPGAQIPGTEYKPPALYPTDTTGPGLFPGPVSKEKYELPPETGVQGLQRRKSRLIPLLDRHGNIHRLIDPGELGEGEDDGRPTFKQPPRDWARRGDGSRFVMGPAPR